MKITVLQGSPNSNCSTAMLVERFADGAREAGHTVDVVEVAKKRISPCTGCVKCGFGGPCVLSDDFDELRAQILASDMVVFATPLYYYGMTAQLKAVIDRFCSANPSITGKRLKSALLTVAWNADDWTFDALMVHYRTLVRYINFDDQGMVLGYGCGTPATTKRSGYPNKAHELGKSLR
jgi:multimeric flavodoxin WrbA